MPTPRETATDETPVEVVNFFRSEARARLDRLARLAADLDSHPDDPAAARSRLMEAMESLAETAGTFGFGAVAEAVRESAEGVRASPAGSVGARVAALGKRMDSELEGVPGDEAPEAEAEAPAPAPPAPAPAPAPAPELELVEMESLLYRGEDALRRALELRSELEEAVAEDARARALLEEVFDLIELGLA